MPDMLVQIRNDGCAEVGGDRIDQTIQNEVVRRYLASQDIEESPPIQTGGMERLLTRCEQAKIDLSTKESTFIYVPDFFRGTGEIRDLEYTLTRSELERICDHFVEQGVGRILELLSKACMDPASIAICLATGGMVNMPMIKSRLREIFGPQRLHISERGNTVIAEGAAWIAHAKRRLTLAKNVELSVAGNSYFPLVKAGTSMPREGEVQRDMFNLYCTNPRDGVAKFQFSSPVVPGRALSTDPRKILDNFSIKVHKEARPYLERLRLDVSIDDNLILKASAFSTMQRDIDEIEIHDLEFGLSLPDKLGSEDANGEGHDQFQVKPSTLAPGSMCLRPNISAIEDWSLVPGELMYELSRKEPFTFAGYFDRMRNPPQRQVEEHLYYQPCGICKRMVNDPLCRCARDLA